MVIVQGVLGGLRVTGHFSWSAQPEELRPSLLLAVVHGVIGQLFFALMAALAAVTSKTWLDRRPVAEKDPALVDRRLGQILLAILLVQLVLGACQRHLGEGLLIHITVAVAVFALVGICGVRAVKLYRDVLPIYRTGLMLKGLVLLQVILGFGALAAVSGEPPAAAEPAFWQIAIATAHQSVGALLLGVTLIFLLWHVRLVTPSTASETPRG
jgi:heme A synthase